MSDFQVSSELLGIYLEDARAHLETLDRCLLSLEREGLDAAVISAVLGPLHTLKGNSGMIGFAGVKDYVHKLEDVFARIGEGSPGSAGVNWQIAATGDLDADGRTDIVWRNQAPSGQVYAWFIEGTSRVAHGAMGAAPHDWQIIDAGDFDGQ